MAKCYWRADVQFSRADSTELRSVRRFLYNVGFKFGNKITNLVLGVQEEDAEKYFNNIAKRSLYCLFS